MAHLLYRNANHIIRARSIWQHTGHGEAWSVRAVESDVVHVESLDGRDRAEFPVAELLRDYVEI